MSSYERLSAQDAAFLYAESPVSHMHVGSLVIFENVGLTEDELNTHIASRLHLVPRFRKKLAWVPAYQGRPVWVDDPHFDIRFHVRYTGLPRPSGEREALTLMGRVMSRPLDRQRPLWELWVFELPDNRLGVIQKTHHCLIDGISGVDLATVLLDVAKHPPPSDPPPDWRPSPIPSRERLLVDAVVERYTKPAELYRTLRAATRTQREFAKRATDVGQGVFSFGKAALERAPLTSLNRQIGPHRRFEIVRMSLDDLKAIKNRFGCTVNDVVLSLVTGGLRKLLLSRGDHVDGLTLKAMVPVSVRDPSQQQTYGNMVSMMTADLPVGEGNPSRRVAFVRQRMAGLKESKQAVGADFWVKFSEYAPPTLLALAGRATAALQRMVNVIVTNVPGPQFPLYLKGGQMLEAFPCVPIMNNAALGVAVLSYNGQLDFGLCGDWDILPDLDVFAAGLEESRRELLDLTTPGSLSSSAPAG
ncbi:MAG TPA: wax ester/triacylglycerol synthase family O-acyltransferase [Polyangiaceae bacterium]|jgi:WS/DGAT/MGAT family acyltransferase|nr:wax ester/triacylglycerol synthase family O-acyltransferase [Polyangiaceae bacterium]